MKWSELNRIILQYQSILLHCTALHCTALHFAVELCWLLGFHWVPWFILVSTMNPSLTIITRLLYIWPEIFNSEVVYRICCLFLRFYWNLETFCKLKRPLNFFFQISIVYTSVKFGKMVFKMFADLVLPLILWSSLIMSSFSVWCLKLVLGDPHPSKGLPLHNYHLLRYSWI